MSVCLSVRASARPSLSAYVYISDCPSQYNKNIKTSSFKSNEYIQKKEGGPDRSVSDDQSSSVTLNELAMKARKIL